MIVADEDIAAWKRQARLAAKARRAGADPTVTAQASARLLRKLPPPPDAIVGGVWPLPGEIDLRPLLHELRRRGHRIALPVTPPRGEPLSFREWHPDSPMFPGRFGTMHCDGAVLSPNYILVPLLAFDQACHRLGYGAGHYDRTLAELPNATTVGVAFAIQEIDFLRTEPTDRALDAIVTERELIRPKA